VSRGQIGYFPEAECYAISVQKQTFDLLEGWLRHKSDMVNYEAARAICEMKNVSSAQLTKPIAG
jgi:coatomer protein complex subunit gamma